jgi:NitT/TauT family transport system permease protein
LLTVLILIAAWELATRSGILNPIIFPPASHVATALVELGQQRFFWDAFRTTMIETLAGFALGAGSAWIFGTLLATFALARYAFYPLAVALQIAPRVALAPLFVVWFGFGITSKVVLAATICFFPVLINVMVGLQTVEQDARVFMRSIGASRWEEYRKLGLPSSLPLLFASLKTAITLALLGAIVAEFAGGVEGMGVLIQTFNAQLDVAEGFAVIIALMIAGLILYGAMELLESRVVFWKSRT